MKLRSRIVLIVMAVGVLSLACNLLNTPTALPVVTQPPAQVEPTVLPVTEPPPLSPEPSTLPAGLTTIREQTLTFYDLNGTQVSQLELPQYTALGLGRMHLAGTMPSSGGVVPLLYLSFDTQEALHFRDGNGQIFALLSGTSFLGLTGVPGQPIVALSQLEYMDTTLRSMIYVGSIQNLPSTAPVSVIDDPESWAIKPILVEAENGAPTKVWYTRTAYGIGGDIVFEPRKGLFVLDLATGQVNTLLDSSVSPWAISDDRNWVAYSAAGTLSNSMCLKNFKTSAETCFPALPAIEPRGTGEAYLSPDAQYITWMEGDGLQMAEVPSFIATIRVAQREGTTIIDLPMNTFEGAAGIGPIRRADPVGWLDNQTIIVQVRGQEWEQVALLRFNVSSQEISYLAPGAFVGLLYR